MSDYFFFENPNAGNGQRQLPFVFTGKSFWGVFSTLVLFGVLSLVLCCFAIRFVNEIADNLSNRYAYLLSAAVPFTLLGSAVCCIRKIYLIAFYPLASDTEENHDERQWRWRKNAAIIYLVARPLFVVVSVYLLLLAIFGGLVGALFGVMDVTAETVEVLFALSFMLGLSGGKVIDSMFRFGDNLLGQMVGQQGGDTR